MVATGQTTLTVRFWKTTPEGHQEHHSYPYRMLSSWCWKKAEKETLEVRVPGGVVTVSGHALDKLAEALDEGRLRTVIALKQGSELVHAGAVCISSIEIKNDIK